MAKRINLDDALAAHEKIDAEYQLALSDFRPQFGNLKHIAIRDAVELLNQLKFEADAIIAAGRGGAKAISDVTMMKRHVLELLA